MKKFLTKNYHNRRGQRNLNYNTIYSRYKMPTLIEIANELAMSFVQARNKKHAANHLIIEINSLRYAYSKKLIEYNLKTAIINVIKHKLATQLEDAILFSKMERFILKKLDIDNESKKDKSLKSISLTLYKGS
jgi:hypothetical protein